MSEAMGWRWVQRHGSDHLYAPGMSGDDYSLRVGAYGWVAFGGSAKSGPVSADGPRSGDDGKRDGIAWLRGRGVDVPLEIEPLTYAEVCARVDALEQQRLALLDARVAGPWEGEGAQRIRRTPRGYVCVRELYPAQWTGADSETHLTAEAAMAALDTRLLAEGWTLEGGVP